MKAWRVRITQPGEEPLEFTIFAKTRDEAERMARFMVHQSFPFARFTVKKMGRVL